MSLYTVTLFRRRPEARAPTGAGASGFGSPYASTPLSSPRPESSQLAGAPDVPFSQIPVVDFGEFLHGSRSQQREVAALEAKGC